VGHLGYFHSLGIVNNAAVNMGAYAILFNLTYILSGISLGVVFLELMAVLSLLY
jgi:hypothetical protein